MSSWNDNLSQKVERISMAGPSSGGFWANVRIIPPAAKVIAAGGSARNGDAALLCGFPSRGESSQSHANRFEDFPGNFRTARCGYGDLAGRVCIRGCKAARDEVCDVDAAGGAGAGSHRRDPVLSVARAASNGLSEMRIHGTTELRILPAMQHGAEPAVPVVRAKSGSRVVGMRVLWDAGGGACGWGEELNIRNRTKQKQTADPSPLKRVRDDIVC